MTERPLAFVLPRFSGGGAERVTLALAAGALEAALPTVLVVLEDAGPLRDAVPEGLRVIDVGKPRLRQALPALVRTLNGLTPRAIVSTFGYLNLPLLAARPVLRGRPALLLREANLPSLSLQRLPAPPLMRLAHRLLYPRADRVIVTSRRMAAEMRAFGVADDRLALLPNPVDSDRLRSAAVPPRRVDGPGRRFVAAGRLVAQKGFDRLLEQLAGQGGDWHLTILGDGPDRAALEGAIRAGGLSETVRLAGFEANPWPWYAGADAVLMPSRFEGMPNVALEALAVGTPVIATPESGGIAELAEQAPPGAVTVAPFGADFVSAMKAVPAAGAPATTRPSLLPAPYHREHVLEAFLRMVEGSRR